jgi:GNAT superfamily N-acetyltransferase
MNFKGLEIEFANQVHFNQIEALVRGTQELEGAVILDQKEPIEQLVLQLLERIGHVSYVALKDSRVIGLTVALRRDNEAELAVPAIVAPDYRNQGIGGILVERNIAALGLNGISETSCLVRFDNEGGIRFLENHRFDISEERITDSPCLVAARRTTLIAA